MAADPVLGLALDAGELADALALGDDEDEGLGDAAEAAFEPFSGDADTPDCDDDDEDRDDSSATAEVQY